MNAQQAVKGNWLALVGTIWYLLEWVFIILFFSTPPPAGSSVADFASYYETHRASITLYGVGITAAILGRLAFMIGLRNAFHSVEEVRNLLDLAFAMTIVTVAVESVSYALESIALGIATFGPEPPVVVAAAFQSANTLIFSNSALVVAFGLVATIASLAMLRVRALPPWIGWVGFIGGVAFTLSVKTGYYPESLVSILESVQFFSWLLIVVWMLATSITLVRRAR